MGKMSVEPAKVQELIKRMDSHARETKTNLQQLKGYVKNMNEHWNDSHYKGFVEQFELYEKSIKKALVSAETLIIPNLKNVRKFAEEYKNLGSRR